MSHYVVTHSLDGDQFFVMTAPTPEFSAILIGATTSSEAAKSFCRELNILAEQVDQSAERNHRLMRGLRRLVNDLNHESTATTFTPGPWSQEEPNA